MKRRSYLILLMSVAGFGGLLYGYDLGIIGTALLYLNKCVHLSEQETGMLASAVMVGALASSLVGGGFSDWMGRKKAMIVSALLFAASVVMIVAATGFWPLFFGRTLQGLSAGMIAVIVPVFMSECVPARIRGVGSTVFQLSITLGILLAMGAGAYYQAGVKDSVAAATGDVAGTLAIEDAAWRNMFRSSIWPAVAFFFVALASSESPRWLFRHGWKDKALEVLLKGRDRPQAELEMHAMQTVTSAAKQRHGSAGGDSLFRRHYIVPLIMAVVLLGINQATGIVAVFTFPVVMLHQSGLSESAATHTGVWLALTNFIVTIFGVLLVDRLGRKALLKIGTGIIIVALTVGDLTFWKVESGRQDVSARLQSAVRANTLHIAVKDIVPSFAGEVQVSVIYAFDGKEQMKLVRSDTADPVLSLAPDATEPMAKLQILRAEFSAAPAEQTGRITFACLLLYIVGFAFGPGVCLWLMSAELLPTRVRSLGMGLGVLCNALVSITTTAVFLPVVDRFGYAAMWAVWLGCTVAYFLFVTFILPETKGRTLEEIEVRFMCKETAVARLDGSPIP